LGSLYLKHLISEYRETGKEFKEPGTRKPETKLGQLEPGTRKPETKLGQLEPGTRKLQNYFGEVKP